MENHDKNGWDLLQGLVRKEEEEAFRIRSGEELLSRLQARLKAAAEKESGRDSCPPHFISRIRMTKMLPVLAPALLAVCLGVLVLLVMIPRPQQGDARAALERFFLDAPGIKVLVSRTQAQGFTQIPGRQQPYLFRQRLEEVSSAIRQEHRMAVEEIARPRPEEPLSSLNLEEKMRILFGERIIHRFFFMYFKKGEEKKNGAKDTHTRHPGAFLPEPVFI